MIKNDIYSVLVFMKFELLCVFFSHIKTMTNTKIACLFHLVVTWLLILLFITWSVINSTQVGEIRH